MDYNNNNQKFDDALSNIKEEKPDFGPISFIRKLSSEINEQNRESDDSDKPMTKLPFDVTLSHPIKFEPIDYGEHESTFEEKLTGTGRRKRKRRQNVNTSNKKVKLQEEDQDNREDKMCLLCGYINPLRCVIVRHIKLHSLPTAIKCNNCLVLCATERTLNMHIKRCH